MIGQCESGLLPSGAGSDGGAGGRGRSLGSIGNMNKQFSLYYISVQSHIYTTQTYILSTDYVL